ncbi:hypothetical protein PEL8287_02546 [Roseovarius litorisediminis]|uniref:Methyltransferase domain protein n=1 Tax=Roseovarius litorisediminis TaxID=1312363 RepID=A0A1Y5SUX5_9RHOB|nr:DUF938 domain-containing protein [Roseovarius litorisediminis]SLN48895.1 hypothetical protein PEL8287_02546 [Roseovarius litorisediminis]
MTDRALPPSASVAHTFDGARLSTPSAARNAQAITDLLQCYVPRSGKALEIASGTGQHVVAFAAAMPELDWQPSEPDPVRRASIDAWAAEAGLPNLRPAISLDACTSGWASQFPGQNLIVLINLLHLITTPEAQILIAEAAKALAPSGRLILYGPFLRAGHATSEGDRRFHTSLIAQDPGIGYKDLDDVRQWLADNGLGLIATVDMPANNLTLIAEHPAETV